jgi:hypothetical protein
MTETSPFDCPYPDACSAESPCSGCVTPASEHNQYCIDDWDCYHGDGPRGMGPNGDGCVCSLAPAPDEPPFSPQLWTSRPDSVVHIAGSQLSMFNRFLRQRCDWCGVVLIEYDLLMVAVPEGQPGAPAMWTPGVLVRVDGHMSAEVEAVEEEPGQTKLPMDSCAFDPLTQVGWR